MALDSEELAGQIQTDMGFSGDLSDELIAIATAIVDHMGTAVVTFATMTGTAPPSGGPLSDGAGVGGMIVLVAATLIADLKSNLGEDTPELEQLGEALSSELANATCEFESGNVVGTCANTAANPGPLVGTAADGTVVGLVGLSIANAIASEFGAPLTQQLKDLGDAIADYITGNAEVSLATVAGLCSAGGGPVAAMTGAGGTIL